MSQEHFAEVAPLVRAGRFKEAAAQLKRSARSGAQRWETYVWLGRIEEKRGRLEDAEKAFRAAVAASPDSSQPCVELARLLEKAGRPEDAMEVLKAAATRACAELSLLAKDLLGGDDLRASAESLYSLMEFNLYRRVFVSEILVKGKAAARLESALHALSRVLPRAGARTLLAEVFIAQGKMKAAEEELLWAFLPDSTGVENSRIEVLFSLIDHGGYGRRLERAILACVSRAGAGEKLVMEWPRIFSCLMGARRYGAAFRLAETMLDKEGNFVSPQHLMWPWFRKTARAVSEDPFIHEELSRLRAAARSGAFPHWFAYYRAILWSALGVHNPEALKELPRLEALDPARYSWMLQSFVLVKLAIRDFDGAVATCSRILKCTPTHWWVRCRMAEAYLGKRQPARALREFERAAREADTLAEREVLTWHGEVLLWLGDYAGALAKLDEAVARGARTFVHGWRGAARFLSGDAEGALEDLDLAVKLDAKDFEARAWRGEVYRCLGRHPQALADLDCVIADSPDVFWAHVNRALLRDSQDLPLAMKEDFLTIPSDVTQYLRKVLRLPLDGELSREQMRRVLSCGLERAKGNRRWELYVRQLWRSPS